jgi:hypothetical protein
LAAYLILMNARQQKYYDLLVLIATPRGFTIIGNYDNARNTIRMQCPYQHIFDISPDNFKKGQGCSRCSNNCPQQSKERFFKCAGERNFTVVGKYTNDQTKTRMQCPCGNLFDMSPHSFKNGQGCPRCSNQCPQQAKEILLDMASQRGFNVISSYIDAHTKIRMQCPCGHIFDITPTNFKSGVDCSRCSDTCPKQAKERLLEVASRRGFTVTGDYVNTRTKIQMKCHNQHIFNITPDHFKNGRGCGICDESAGEQLVRASVTHLNLFFVSQYVLPSLPGRKYDFAIILPNRNPVFLEWDGEQHFEQSEYFHRYETTFLQGQRVDIMKTQEVIDHRCQMIRIDYTWLNKGQVEIAEFIKNAIHSNKWLIVSNEDKYTWLSQSITLPKVRLVIRKKPEHEL